LCRAVVIKRSGFSLLTEIKFLGSSLHCEVCKCAFLACLRLFDSAELIYSHDGDCLKVRADLVHLIGATHCPKFW
jgi:hypothetical protein